MLLDTRQKNSSPVEEQHDIRARRRLDDALAIDDLPVESHVLSVCVDLVEFDHEFKLNRN